MKLGEKIDRLDDSRELSNLMTLVRTVRELADLVEDFRVVADGLGLEVLRCDACGRMTRVRRDIISGVSDTCLRCEPGEA
jgi:hypothetical protein